MYFVVYRGLGVSGVVFSALISGIILATVLSIYTIRSVGLSFSRDQAKKLVKFTAPLILAALGSFYITFGDRYFLRVFSGLDSVGIYSLGYKFGFILVVLTWMPFQQVWDSQRYIIGRRPDARESFGRVFSIMASVMITGALVIALFVEDLLKIMAAPEFWPAHRIVPIILLAYLLQCWTNFCRYGLLLGERTVEVTYGAWIAAGVVTVGYITLIPLFDAIGAAVATLGAFLARFLFEYYRARKIYDMELPWASINLLLALGATAYGLGHLLPNGLIISVTLKLIIVLGFVSVVLFSPVIRAPARQLMVQSIGDAYSHIRKWFQN